VQQGDNIVLVYGSNPVVTFNTNQGPILIELFPEAAPGTVENFLDYVNNGDYEDSIFHRLVPNFVLQGGGFTSDAEDFTNVGQFDPIETDDPIQNEFELSNVRGTIAMAKLGGNPNSATSQWFVNLADNSNNLDNTNGGFTVFGQVLGMWTGSMEVPRSTVDVIAGFSRATPAPPSPFGELPLDSGGNVVLVESVEGEGTVRGTIFVDANNNQSFDSGEVGIDDVTVFVDANQNGTLDSGEMSTTTDDDGNYVFRLDPGAYQIRQVVETPFFQTSPLSPGFHSVTVEIGREETDLDFANAVLGANDDTFEVNEDSQAVDLDVLENDIVGGSGEELTITMVGTPDQGGTVTIAEDQASLIYTPEANFFGTETFTYEVTGTEGSVQATIVVQVLPVNDPPMAVDDEYSIEEDTATTLMVLANDLQAPDSGETLRVTEIVTPPAMGTVEIGPGGEFVEFTPPQNFVGTVMFTYRISDRASGGLTDEATVTLNVTEANDPPVAVADSFTTAEDSEDVELDVLANDSIGPDEGETLTISAVGSFSNGGSATISADSMRVIYTPAADFFGTETFTYTLRDSRGATAQGTVTVTVTPLNDPPTAVNDTFTFTKDTGPHELNVLANDTIEPDEDEELVITNATVPAAAGTVEVINNGQRIRYTPAEGFTGDAVITYTINDGDAGTDEATATVTIRDFVPSSLAGFVYFDRDDDGVFDSAEAPIGGVTITLAGTDDFGESVNRTAVTAANGSYLFDDLAPGSYTITQTQPTLVLDGKDTVGSQGGQMANNQFTIELDEDVTGTGNNFGELGRSAQLVGLMDFFAIRPQPLVLAAVTPSGQAWYSARDDWRDFDEIEVDPDADQSDVEVTVFYGTDEEDAITAPTAGSQVRIMHQSGQTMLVGLLVNSQTFGFTAPESSSPAMAVAAVDALFAEEGSESESEHDEDLLAALLADPSGDEEAAHDAALAEL
jgi:cyclophilin family peptidyl-prolyl cis-trans isomerase